MHHCFNNNDTIMKSFITIFLFLLSIIASAQSADALYEAGKKLYDEKKYTEAVKKLTPAAQKGHKKAQYRLGRCYDKGYGVTEDNQKAYQWYLKGNAECSHSIPFVAACGIRKIHLLAAW